MAHEHHFSCHQTPPLLTAKETTMEIITKTAGLSAGLIPSLMSCVIQIHERSHLSAVLESGKKATLDRIWGI